MSADRILARLSTEGLYGRAERIATDHGIDVRDMFDDSRAPELAHARQHLWTEIHAEGVLGYRRLGQIFERDPSTIRDGIDLHLNRQPRRRVA